MKKKEPATVLIVDDDPILLNIVAEQVSFFGYDPIMASSGEEALKVAPQAKIDLLLTDIMMPKMNGVILAKQFLKLYPEAKVLFMSGHMCQSMVHYQTADGEPAFVQKTFLANTLIAKMRDVLAGPAMDLPQNDSSS